jgi:hypothetical protein
VRCKVCSKKDGKDLFVPKIDNLWKHARKRKALMVVLGICVVGEYYMNKDFFHAVN